MRIPPGGLSSRVENKDNGRTLARQRLPAGGANAREVPQQKIQEDVDRELIAKNLEKVRILQQLEIEEKKEKCNAKQ